jgi:hypothetical protein
MTNPPEEPEVPKSYIAVTVQTGQTFLYDKAIWTLELIPGRHGNGNRCVLISKGTMVHFFNPLVVEIKDGS